MNQKINDIHSNIDHFTNKLENYLNLREEPQIDY